MTGSGGLVLDVLVHPAKIQDVLGEVLLFQSLRWTYPDLTHIFADRG